jgi:hypothetical protein
MANYYTHFVMPVAMTEEQVEFTTAVMEAIDDMASGEDFDDDSCPPHVLSLARQIFGEIENYCSIEINHLDGDVYVWTDSAGDVSIDAPALLLQGVMAHFQIEGSVGLEYANTCDRGRPGGFGGGAAFISKDGIEWLGTRAWLEQKLSADRSFALSQALDAHQLPEGVELVSCDPAINYHGLQRVPVTLLIKGEQIAAQFDVEFYSGTALISRVELSAERKIIGSNPLVNVALDLAMTAPAASPGQDDSMEP